MSCPPTLGDCYLVGIVHPPGGGCFCHFFCPTSGENVYTPCLG